MGNCLELRVGRGRGQKRSSYPEKSLGLLFIFFYCVLFCSSFQEKLETYQIVNNYAKAVVLVLSTNQDKGDVWLGSGFIVDPKGIVITNYHVIKAASNTIIRLFDGNVFNEISIIEADAMRDIAVIKINGHNLPVIKLGNSDVANIGEPIVVIGNPMGLENTVSDGLISGIRKIDEKYYLHQISAPISSGSSGSPVFNMKGEVSGIATASIIDGQNLNFSIPINYAKSLIKGYVKNNVQDFPDKVAKNILKGKQDNTVSDLAEFMETIDQIVRKIYEASDAFYYGISETLEPHYSGFRPDQFKISSFLYLASEAIGSALEDVIKIKSIDYQAMEIIDGYEKTIIKIKNGIEICIQELQAYPNQSQSIDWNKVTEGYMKVTSALLIYGDPTNIKMKKFVNKISPELLKKMLPAIEMSDWNNKYPVSFGAMWGNGFSGVFLLSIDKGSVAESAKLKRGDTILGVYSGESFPSIREFYNFLMNRKPGDIKVLLISRGGGKQLAKVIFK